MAEDTDSFLSRWSRRKAGVRAGSALVAEPVSPDASPPAVPQPLPPAALVPPDEAAAGQPAPGRADAAAVPPPPTMADVALLTRESDYTRYLAGEVSPEVKNAALKHLFTDPHFNVMDGLDTYIGDYNTPDPLPAGMLRQMVQSQLLGLFDDEATADATTDAQAGPPAAPEPATPIPSPPLTADAQPLAADENLDLQLQPDDDAGRSGLEPGAGAHAGRPD